MKTETLHTEQDTSLDLWKLIGESVAILWKDWPKNMQVTVFDSVEGRFSLTGECPHCNSTAVFTMVGRPDYAPAPYGHKLIASIMQCPGCELWILAIVKFYQGNVESFRYETHYPLGTPNETLDPSIPKEVAEDFKEAIRCQWAKAYRACVVMCGRAIENSARALNAKGANFSQQIDDLGARGIITQPLKEFAHEIRLERNIGAHPDTLRDITEKDAEDVMAFTYEYLDHVYVMPAKLAARKPKAATTTSAPAKTTP